MAFVHQSCACNDSLSKKLFCFCIPLSFIHTCVVLFTRRVFTLILLFHFFFAVFGSCLVLGQTCQIGHTRPGPNQRVELFEDQIQEAWSFGGSRRWIHAYCGSKSTWPTPTITSLCNRSKNKVGKIWEPTNATSRYHKFHCVCVCAWSSFRGRRCTFWDCIQYLKVKLYMHQVGR